MGKKGECFVPLPALGITTREDMDRLCHFELDEAVNLYLHLYASSQPGGGKLYLAAVNPDGVREGRPRAEWLYVWHPKDVALELKERFFSEDLEEEQTAHHIRWVYEKRKACKSVAYSRLQMQLAVRKEVQAELDKLEADEERAKAEQEEDTKRRLADGC